MCDVPQLSQTIKDQLRQLILEARVEEMQPPALQYPLVNPDDISIVNAVTPFAASHGQGAGAVIGGPSFERIYALVNELVAECARVCAAHNIQGTLRQVCSGIFPSGSDWRVLTSRCVFVSFCLCVCR